MVEIFVYIFRQIVEKELIALFDIELEVKEAEEYIWFKYCEGMKNSFVSESVWYLKWTNGEYVIGEVDFTCISKRREPVDLCS